MSVEITAAFESFELDQGETEALLNGRAHPLPMIWPVGRLTCRNRPSSTRAGVPGQTSAPETCGTRLRGGSTRTTRGCTPT
jgi:hypothetical protein